MPGGIHIPEQAQVYPVFREPLVKNPPFRRLFPVSNALPGAFRSRARILGVLPVLWLHLSPIRGGQKPFLAFSPLLREYRRRCSYHPAAVALDHLCPESRPHCLQGLASFWKGCDQERLLQLLFLVAVFSTSGQVPRHGAGFLVHGPPLSSVHAPR